MAKVVGNAVLHGVSGILGGQLVVRRRRNGTAVLAIAPKRPQRPSTPAQAARRSMFREAVLYAKVAQWAPAYAAAARPFNLAVADFLRRPEIRNLAASTYGGRQQVPIAGDGAGAPRTSAWSPGALALRQSPSRRAHAAPSVAIVTSVFCCARIGLVRQALLATIVQGGTRSASRSPRTIRRCRRPAPTRSAATSSAAPRCSSSGASASSKTSRTSSTCASASTTECRSRCHFSFTARDRSASFEMRRPKVDLAAELLRDVAGALGDCRSFFVSPSAASAATAASAQRNSSTELRGALRVLSSRPKSCD